jgi:hypothetical protein
MYISWANFIIFWEIRFRGEFLISAISNMTVDVIGDSPRISTIDKSRVFLSLTLDIQLTYNDNTTGIPGN